MALKLLTAWSTMYFCSALFVMGSMLGLIGCSGFEPVPGDYTTLEDRADVGFCESSTDSTCLDNQELTPFATCRNFIQKEGIAACEFYLCRERVLNPGDRCGPSGYYEGFGYKYCTRFQQTAAERLSPEGIAWVNRVMPCLMRAIDDEIDLHESCDEVSKIAYDSHPGCYIGTGFCELSWLDMAWIFWTIDATDIDMRQVVSTGVDCVSQWAD